MPRFWAAIVIASALPSLACAASSCDAEPGWASVQIEGSIRHPLEFRHATAAGAFALLPTNHGWRIAIFDQSNQEVPVFSAPLRPVETNPVNIAGWHFRNSLNTGPNTGDVNAPQSERRFVFGTLATDLVSQAASAQPPGEGFGGLGALTITGFDLTPPDPGRRAGFTEMSFDVCLHWQGGGDRLAPIVSGNSGEIFDNVVATMRGCGLNADEFEVSDRMAGGRFGTQASFLFPDMDGDSIADLVTLIARRSDAAPGLAICLVGPERLILVGYDGRIGRHLDLAYFGRADSWVVHSGPIYQGSEEGVPPELKSEAIVLGKDDSSSVIVYLTNELTISSYWQGD